MNSVGLIAWGLSGICALIVGALWPRDGRRRDDHAEDFLLWEADLNTKTTEETS